MRLRLLPLAILFLAAANAGCSVLTKNQVKEVNKFAVAAKGYTEMPATVITEHARIRKVKQVLKASGAYKPETAVKALEIGVAQDFALVERGKRADAALAVLKDYAELLLMLTSDQFTTDLQAASESLGKSIDRGISQYNKLQGDDLSLFGSKVAAAVRGVGGLYIRREQEKALKHALESANQVIPTMMESVQEMMLVYLDGNQVKKVEEVLGRRMAPSALGGILSAEKVEVIDLYKNAVQHFSNRQPPSLPMLVADEMEASDTTAELAARAIIAADSFNRAHLKLVEAVKEKRDLAQAIEEIQVLADQVKSAIAVKKKIEQH